jgi:hypothetical protein
VVGTLISNFSARLAILVNMGDYIIFSLHAFPKEFLENV